MKIKRFFIIKEKRNFSVNTYQLGMPKPIITVIGQLSYSTCHRQYYDVV